MNKQQQIHIGDRFQTSNGEAWAVMIVRPFGVVTMTTEDFCMQSDFRTSEVREMGRLEGRNEEIVRRMCVA